MKLYETMMMMMMIIPFAKGMPPSGMRIQLVGLLPQLRWSSQCFDAPFPPPNVL